MGGGGDVRIGHLEAPSGASGDMWLGAVVGAGASIETIQDCVDRLGIGEVRLLVGRVRRAGAEATTVRVRPPQQTGRARTWPDLRTLIEEAELPPAVRDRSHATLHRVATARAALAGVPVDRFELHEVGALDLLGDVVGTCAGVADLGIERLTVGPVAVGAASAAARAILRGHRLVRSEVDAELLTPTGAALLAELTEPVDEPPAFTIEATGAGAGAADLPEPNVLRLHVGPAAGR